MRSKYNNTYQIIPPIHCHEVSEPLMRELVCDNSANSLLLAVAGLERIDEQVDLAILLLVLVHK